MTNAGEDLDLLLSLGEERVLETPPASPSSHHSTRPGYNSDDGSPRRAWSGDMSVFRAAVKDYLDAEPAIAPRAPSKPERPRNSHEVEVEKFSGLRIRNPLVSSVELSNRLADIRFVRLSVIRNLLSGDTLSGGWATLGVLTEKGAAKVSSVGKAYGIFKMSGLDESDVSVFLFGDAYTKNCDETIGTIFALFNSAVRKDSGGKGYSLSVYTAGQMLKIGTSADYAVCRGKRKDGMACTMVINKRQGAYCKFHTSKASQKYFTARSELKGGNLHNTFRLRSEGIYMVDPLADRSSMRKPLQRAKILSVDGLRKALSNADKVTTNGQSQGIRFLTQVTANMESKFPSKRSARPEQTNGSSGKRSSLVMNKATKTVKHQLQPDDKRTKTHHASDKLIELDIVSSDEEG